MTKRVDAQHVKTLGEALLAAFLTVQDLTELLHDESLGKEFKNLASEDWPLGRITQELASRSFEQGWASQLLLAALAMNPDNPRLRALWSALPEGDDPTTGSRAIRVDSRLGKPSLRCGRGEQWNGVSTWATTPAHQAIVVSGVEGQAPMHFRERIEVWLDVQPPNRILRVDWPTRPARREAFFEALGNAFDVADGLRSDEETLRATVSAGLAAGHVVLLHPLLTLDFNDPNLLKYYLEWLPDLVKRSPHAHKLKCVQPIEWRRGSSRSFWSRLLSDPEAEPHGEAGARELIARLEAAHDAPMPIIPLKELADLTPDEVRAFGQLAGLTRKQQDRMLEVVASVEPVPARVFEAIDTCWGKLEELR